MTLLLGNIVFFRVIVTNGSGYGLNEFWFILSHSTTSNLEYYYPLAIIYANTYLYDYINIIDILVSAVNSFEYII